MLRGGVHKLQAAFATAELARKAKLEKMQVAWCTREADIDARLKDANDVLARTLPADREAAQMSVDVIEDTRRSGAISIRRARSTKEKVQLERGGAADREAQARRRGGGAARLQSRNQGRGAQEV